jgi:hypothetical protein
MLEKMWNEKLDRLVSLIEEGRWEKIWWAGGNDGS